MAAATTAKYERMPLQIETSPGVFTVICGMKDVTVDRNAQVDTAEIPDCDDESLPFSVERQVRSIEVMVTATGVWARESHGTLMDWFYSSATKVVRIGHLNAGTGTTEYETGPALLTKLANGKTKGQKISADISIEFDGTPTRSAKA